ncbi:hypothetical protein [Neolewinella agarilytica]|uniref:hypothetical protein n=1 Tax=Neolewinella agarilytica TaxID=478744 RepID=UPI00111434D2|nr:hypothetical protein [Neolewinella agarilytica]
MRKHSIRISLLAILFMFTFAQVSTQTIQVGPPVPAKKYGLKKCPDGTFVIRCGFGEGICQPFLQLPCPGQEY